MERGNGAVRVRGRGGRLLATLASRRARDAAREVAIAVDPQAEASEAGHIQDAKDAGDMEAPPEPPNIPQPYQEQHLSRRLQHFQHLKWRSGL